MAATDIVIEGTRPDPDALTRRDLRATQAFLRARVTELTVRPHAEATERTDALVEFCGRDVREYLIAADRSLHTPAAANDNTRLLAEALRLGAVALNDQIDQLTTCDPDDRIRLGTALATCLDLQLRIEESVLLPALGRSPVSGPSPRSVDRPDEMTAREAVIDVRRIARGGRHPRVFARFAALAPGESFVLVHSHDPKPLRQEFETMHRGQFSWEYLEAGPEEWHVRIGRVAADA